MPLSDWNDGARTAGQTLGGGGNFNGMGGYGGQGGNIGGSTYQFNQVPGTNTFGNWNTGGPVAGFGGLGGISTWGGGFGPVGPSLAAPGGYSDPVLSGPLGPAPSYTPTTPTYAEPAMPEVQIGEWENVPEPAAYTSVPGLISPGWSPGAPSYPGVEAELGYDPNAGWEAPATPQNPIGGMSYTPGLPASMPDPYSMQTVAPGKTDFAGMDPYAGQSVAPGKTDFAGTPGRVTAEPDGFAALPGAVPSAPVGGMSYTPGLPSPMMQQPSAYDYLRTTPGPAGMDYTPDLPQMPQAPEPPQTQMAAEGKTDFGGLLGGITDYENLVSGNDMFRDAMAMGARPSRVSLLNASMPYSDPFSTGGAFSNLADYSGASRKMYADRVPY